MLVILLFLVSLARSARSGSLPYFTLFHALRLLILVIIMFHGAEVLWQIDPSRPSDTKLYYSAYNAQWADMSNYTFYEYPFLLRLLTFPFVNALFAVWGQGVLIFLLLDVIVKNKRNLLMFVLFHLLLYLSTNMLKDNMLLILGLSGYVILERVRNSWLQCLVIAVVLSMMSWVRPFIAIALPMSFLPLFLNIRSVRLKNVLLTVIFLVIIVVIVRLKASGYIDAIAGSMSEGDEAADQASIPVALVRIFFGPTPSHYLHAEQFMSQPFFPGLKALFAVLHYIYYVFFALFAAYVAGHWREVFNIHRASVARVFVLMVSMIQMVVYTLIYGGADIRQRAIILTLFFLFCFTDKNIFTRRMSRNGFVVFMTTLFGLTILTVIL